MKKAKQLKSTSAYTHRKPCPRWANITRKYARGEAAMKQCRKMCFPKHGSLRIYNLAWRFASDLYD